MTIEINDTRNKSKTVLRDNLQEGETYVDTDGDYVLCTDSEFVVILDTAVLCGIRACYNEDDEFIPVKCKLEVYG